MERNLSSSDNWRKGKRIYTPNKLTVNEEVKKEVENYSKKPVNNQVLVSQLYISIQSAVNDLLVSIVAECARRISSIKKSTLQASEQITKLKHTLNEMLKNKDFSEASIKKLKDMSTEASFYYKPQCEEFNFFIDKVAGEVKKSENLGNLVVQYPKESPGISRWGIVRNDGSIKELPDWVNKQIEAGVGYGASEINIFKKSEIVSIADVKKMTYYGLLKGSRLPGQDLKKIR